MLAELKASTSVFRKTLSEREVLLENRYPSTALKMAVDDALDPAVDEADCRNCRPPLAVKVSFDVGL